MRSFSKTHVSMQQQPELNRLITWFAFQNPSRILPLQKRSATLLISLNTALRPKYIDSWLIERLA